MATLADLWQLFQQQQQPQAMGTGAYYGPQQYSGPSSMSPVVPPLPVPKYGSQDEVRRAWEQLNRQTGSNDPFPNLPPGSWGR
jgi:hypothetical protein